MADEKKDTIDFAVDKANFYHEETFTDLKIASIRRLTPVKPDGSVDKTRKTVFVGHTNLFTPNGPVPVQNLIQARELQQAIKKFPEAMKEAMERLVDEVKKHKAKEESRIIVPGR
jgi:hypothetical protein